ncbi:FCD domain-containing protein [Pseudotabrizicola sp. 4114]|uniref:GntR family transcriptional regulator n=1 Tax=Pseudotabrizicola sp. 4114 TaxID=2817731 RepID=UPI00285630BE|nr:DNA-binding GntR family transcriptional regulator [Pseudorhodobacter sp. 4114]
MVDQLYSALRAAIIENVLYPGARISEAEVREAIEADIVKLLAHAPDPTLIADLRAQVDRQQDLVRGAAREFMIADESNHRTLAEGAGKDKAWHIVVEMKAQMDRIRVLSGMHFPANRLIDQHRDVLGAIAQRAPDKAEHAMRCHLQGILTDLPAIKQEQPEYFL